VKILVLRTSALWQFASVCDSNNALAYAVRFKSSVYIYWQSHLCILIANRPSPALHANMLALKGASPRFMCHRRAARIALHTHALEASCGFHSLKKSEKIWAHCRPNWGLACQVCNCGRSWHAKQRVHFNSRRSAKWSNNTMRGFFVFGVKAEALHLFKLSLAYFLCTIF
jgi:hypothetical protein